METKNTRPYEAIIVASAFVVYVVQRLFNLSKEIDESISTAYEEATKRAIDGNTILRLDTNDPVQYAFPIIASALLLLTAWLIFHLMVWPNRNDSNQKKNLLLSTALVLVLIFASLFVFHWNMVYLRYSRDLWRHITGLISYSLYRKKTILGDAIGIGFLFVFYELVSSAFAYLRIQLLKEKDTLNTIIANLVFALPAAFVLVISLGINIPTPLWSTGAKTVLLWISSIVVVWAMQEYIVRLLLPNYKAAKPVLFQHFFVFTAIWLIGNTLIWAAYTNFYFYNHPSAFLSRSLFLQLIRTLFPAIVFAVFRKAVLKEKTVLQQQVAGTSAELAQLRSQINPHFLFNALNSLYAAAMKEKADRTADGIQRLGDMMRFMLQENNQERISVEKEIEYLHNYIHLQRIRIDETQGIDIKVVLNQPDNAVYIAPMMLIPFVENAFKHGISHRSPSWIFITLSFDATHLYFRVQNSRHIRHEADPEEYQSGIGLQNVEKRLNLLYPDRHTLYIQESDHDYTASLTLSLW